MNTVEKISIARWGRELMVGRSRIRWMAGDGEREGNKEEEEEEDEDE